jgi:hypothetical protein
VHLPGLSACWLDTHKTTDQALRDDQAVDEPTAAAKGSTSKTREDYHNARLSVERRVDDLLRRMTLAEKAGMLFQSMIVVGSGDLAERSSEFGVESAEHMINNQLLSHFNVVRAADDSTCCAENWGLTASSAPTGAW